MVCVSIHCLSPTGDVVWSCSVAILHGQQDALRGDCSQVRPARSTAALQSIAAGVLPQAQAPPATAVHVQHKRGSQQRPLHQTHHHGHVSVSVKPYLQPQLAKTHLRTR